jgi:amidohydrolase
MHPEPSMQEHETAAYVVERLREIGLADIQTGIGETGVVCLIRGAKKRGKTVALRADMDALEMAEETGAEYASRKPGLMHACGHDGHTACLLGAAAILHGMRERLPGNVKLIFQPGEEGAGGALKMIEDGCLARPKVSAIAALHVFGDLQSGAIGLNHGYITAQTDEIELIIRGVSAHAARPHTGVDSISVAAQALIAIQQFVARHTDPIDRRLVTFGIIEGGTRSNILAQQVRLRVSHDEGYPPLANDEDVINTIGEAARETLGEARVHELTVPSLGGEDFAYFARAGVPTAMGRLGTYDEEKGFTSTVHRTDFDFDDGVVLPTGAAALAQTAMRLLDA